eukprot:1058485-Prorocentrum_minimum.AAC.1
MARVPCLLPRMASSGLHRPEPPTQCEVTHRPPAENRGRGRRRPNRLPNWSLGPAAMECSARAKRDAAKHEGARVRKSGHEQGARAPL